MVRTACLSAMMVAAIAVSAFSQAVHPKLVLVYADDVTQVIITTPDGTSTPGQIGSEVFAGSSIQTGNTGLEMQMAPNGTAIRLAAHTTFLVNGLIGNSNDKTNSFYLIKGKLRMVAAKLSRAGTSYVVETPTATAGVRGTDFARRYDPAAGADWLCVLDGVVDFHSPDNSASISVGGGEFVDLTQGFVAAKVPSSWVTTNFADLQFIRATTPR